MGIHFITFAIFAFAFSSLIGNYFYAETNFRYIFKNTKWGMLIFRVLCLAAIFYGCVNSFDLAWNLADIFMGFMGHHQPCGHSAARQVGLGRAG